MCCATGKHQGTSSLGWIQPLPTSCLSKAHTGCRTHFPPLASQVLRGPGSLHKWRSCSLWRPVRGPHPEVSPCICMGLLSPKGPLCPLPLSKFCLPYRLRSQMEPLSPSQGTFSPEHKGEESEGRCPRTRARETHPFSPMENLKSKSGVK